MYLFCGTRLSDLSLPSLHLFILYPSQLRDMVSGPSSYNDERREGIVVRLCDEATGQLLARCKLVRSDFIAGNQRWNTAAKLATNTLALSHFTT